MPAQLTPVGRTIVRKSPELDIPVPCPNESVQAGILDGTTAFPEALAKVDFSFMFALYQSGLRLFCLSSGT